MKPKNKIQPENKKAILLCRVSSEKQRENYSLARQERAGKEYAARKGYTITKVARIVESASKPGRKEFDAYLDHARTGPETHILIPKVDRSLRNVDDLAVIVRFPKDHPSKHLHFFDDNIVYKHDSDSSVVFMLMMQGARATWETAVLAERTKGGMEQKARQGGWPNRAPTGYVNDKATRTLHVQPEMRPWIVRLHELAKTGEHSLEAIGGILAKEGCPKRLSKSTLAYIIHNPLYAGFVEWPKNSGHLIKGQHEPIVSWELHNAAVAGLERYDKPQYGSREFRFKGLMRCARCECAVVGEMKKGRYTYYRCGRNSPTRKCDTKGYVSEAAIEEQALEMLRSIKLKPEMIERTLEYLAEVAPFDATEKESRIAVLKQERSRTTTRKEKLLDLLADATLSEADWKKKSAEYDERLLGIEAEIKRLEETAPSAYLPLARSSLELANSCETLYKSMTDEKKRELMSALHSNLALDDKKLMPAWRKPFDSIARLASCPNWLRD